MMIRRLALSLIAAAGLAAFAPAQAGSEENAVGRRDAPVTVIEYRSFVCPHCAEWERDVAAEFKAKYVATGQVRLVYRDMLTAPAQTAATAAGVVRCAAPERREQVAEVLFRNQDSIAPVPDSEFNYAFQQRVATWLGGAIAVSGRSQEQISTCIQDPAILASIRAQIEEGMAMGVTGTPTFVVNGRKIEGHGSMAELSAAIDPLLGRR